MNWWFLATGLAVHLVFFASIFDIYFSSPLVHGMTPHSSPHPAPARRLVFFLTDGLRADRLFEVDDHGQTRAPFIRDIIQNVGAWGVSHTHVPTETRPGCVAIAAGFYEDVSAVAKGWKENPVEFDSIFNESRYTWSWGSPDVLPMFAKGASGDHISIEMYPAESEDFAGADTTKLDLWVFDQVRMFLEKAKEDTQLMKKLREDKVVLFLHLLGLDTNGHSHRPYSKEYLENIQVVDAGIRKITKMVDELFNSDGATAFVITADHGMTNWGSHGAGHPSETLTPLVAWGAGVRGPRRPTAQDQYTDGFEHEWKLADVKRTDVNQADIAALMAALIGVPFPLNSVGLLPLDYLDATEEQKALAIFANARQIVAQLDIKMQQKKETTLNLLFTPFEPLTPAKQDDMFRHISEFIQNKDYSKSIMMCQELIELALQGLNYYHNYDRLFLGTSIALGFLGWMSYVLVLICKDHTGMVRPKHQLEQQEKTFWKSAKGIRITFIVIGVIIIFLLRVQSLPWTYYIYCLLPLVLWYHVCQNLSIFRDAFHYTIDSGYGRLALLVVILGIAGMEILVSSFFHREVLSIGLIGMIAWPLVSSLWSADKLLSVTWIGVSLLMAIFPMLPVVGREANYNLVVLAGVISLSMAIYCIFRPEMRSYIKQDQTLVIIQVGVLCLSIYIVMSTSSSIASRAGLPLFNQVASWIILALSMLAPLFASTRVYPRLFTIILGFMSPYLLLSTSHEGLFCLVLCSLMFLWLQLEHKLSHKQQIKLVDLDFHDTHLLGYRPRQLIMADLRTAYFFIFFLLAAFFGTGNIASINSFEVASVYCFLTVFSPFFMGALMLWKILIPFLLVTCSFNAIHVSVNVPTQSLFLVVLFMSDFMALHFFFMVRDYGSWLEIGTSISHYVIVMAMICFLLILLAISKIFTRCRIATSSNHKLHSK